MPQIARQIEGCSYDPVTPIAAFNYHNLPIIIEPKKLTIYNAENKEEAYIFMDWPKNELKNS